MFPSFNILNQKILMAVNFPDKLHFKIFTNFYCNTMISANEAGLYQKLIFEKVLFSCIVTLTDIQQMLKVSHLQ